MKRMGRVGMRVQANKEVLISDPGGGFNSQKLGFDSSHVCIVLCLHTMRARVFKGV